MAGRGRPVPYVRFAHLSQFAAATPGAVIRMHARAAKLRYGMRQFHTARNALGFWCSKDRTLDQRCRVTSERDVDIAGVGRGCLDQIRREERDGCFQPLRQ